MLKLVNTATNIDFCSTIDKKKKKKKKKKIIMF